MLFSSSSFWHALPVLLPLLVAFPTLFFQRYCETSSQAACSRCFTILRPRHGDWGGVSSFFGPGAFLSWAIAALDAIWDNEGRQFLEELRESRDPLFNFRNRLDGTTGDNPNDENAWSQVDTSFIAAIAYPIITTIYRLHERWRGDQMDYVADTIAVFVGRTSVFLSTICVERYLTSPITFDNLPVHARWRLGGWFLSYSISIFSLVLSAASLGERLSGWLMGIYAILQSGIIVHILLFVGLRCITGRGRLHVTRALISTYLAGMTAWVCWETAWHWYRGKLYLPRLDVCEVRFRLCPYTEHHLTDLDQMAALVIATVCFFGMRVKSWVQGLKNAFTNFKRKGSVRQRRQEQISMSNPVGAHTAPHTDLISVPTTGDIADIRLSNISEETLVLDDGTATAEDSSVPERSTEQEAPVGFSRLKRRVSLNVVRGRQQTRS